MKKTPGEVEPPRQITKAEREARKAFRQVEAEKAMSEYEIAQEAFSKNRERLKAERLAREAVELAAGTDWLIGRGDAALAGRALSSDEPIGSASDRHAWLAEALDLPRCAPGWGFRYLTSFPDGFDGGPLTPVGDTGPQEDS